MRVRSTMVAAGVALVVAAVAGCTSAGHDAEPAPSVIAAPEAVAVTADATTSPGTAVSGAGPTAKPGVAQPGGVQPGVAQPGAAQPGAAPAPGAAAAPAPAPAPPAQVAPPVAGRPAPGAVGPPAIGIRIKPPVPVGAPAAFADVQLAAKVTKIDSVQVGASGPGEIAGTAVAATVEFTNESIRPVDLGGVVVNAYYGANLPAAANSQPPAAPATGTLAPRQSRTGVYVFEVPDRDRASVTIEVNYSGSADVVIIRR